VNLPSPTTVRRYAALNLALLHQRFGHKRAAVAAAKEAISLAQLASDNVCLRHALVRRELLLLIAEL